MSGCVRECRSARRVTTKVSTLSKLAEWSRERVWCMKLTRNQSVKLLHDRGIWLTEACDKCGRLLGSVRWTRKDEPGGWCSAGCRDGIKARADDSRTCRECGVPLEGKRADSEFCSRTHLMRHRRKSQTAQKRQIIGNTRIGKQGLRKAENGKSTATLSSRLEALETAVCTNSISAKEAAI